MISLICVYNNKKVLDSCLLYSYNKQEKNNTELILVDNSKNKYKNAIEALEYGVQQSKGEYYIFIHQDITFEDKNVLKNMEYQIKSIKDFGIIGVAGYKNKQIISNIIHGQNKEYAGTLSLDVPVACDSVDECLFIIKKSVYDKYKFDKDIIDGWHLYAVEFCLNMRKNNLPVLVIPCNLYHNSNGSSFDKSYYKYLRRLARKYRKNFKVIGTTVGVWYTNPFLLEIKILIRKIKIKLNII